MTKAFFIAVAGGVGVVLWYLVVQDSLKDRVALLGHRARGRYLLGAIAGVAIVVLTAGAIIAARDFGSRGKVAREATPKPRSIGQPTLVSPRVVFRPFERSAKPVVHKHRVPERRTTPVSYVVKTAPASAAATQPAPSVGPAPLPAPNASPPSPLTPP